MCAGEPTGDADITRKGRLPDVICLGALVRCQIRQIVTILNSDRNLQDPFVRESRVTLDRPRVDHPKHSGEASEDPLAILATP